MTIIRTRWVILPLLLLALSATPGPVSAGDDPPSGKPVRLTGFITDEWCGKANANPKGAECARACAKKGSDLVIFADGKIFKLSDKQQALEHLGYEVVVTGSLDSAGVVQIASIKKAESKAPAQR